MRYLFYYPKPGRCKMAPRYPGAVMAVAMLAISGCARTRPPNGTVPEPALHRLSTKAQRQSLSLTIYNHDFGLVREVRQVELGPGRVDLDYRDVAARVEPASVHLRPALEGQRLQVLEQNFRYDGLDAASLLKAYLGKVIYVTRLDANLGREVKKPAKVLACEPNLVLEIDGVVQAESRSEIPGMLTFPGVPRGVSAEPAFQWLLSSDLPRQNLELSYLTNGIGWQANYVMSLNADETQGNLGGWITIKNLSGTSFESTEVKLVAGDVQRRGEIWEDPESRGIILDSAPQDDTKVRHEGLFEYQLYTLPRRTTILNKETKQIGFLQLDGLHVDKRLIVQGKERFYQSRYLAMPEQTAGLYLEFRTPDIQHQGLPLPAGTVRTFKSDSTGADQFIGEDKIDHTPPGEMVRIELGNPADVVLKRLQTNWTRTDHCSAESEWELEFSNLRAQAVTVTALEPVGRDWRLNQSSLAPSQRNGASLEFTVVVPARATTQLTYAVHTSSCKPEANHE
jgi:hypothetical protein